MSAFLQTLPADAFVRTDNSDDAIFYSRDRLVDHLDTLALRTIEETIGRLVVEEEPAILDLMASCDSHIPASVSASRAVGLGLNERELTTNPALDEFVIHDLNKEPVLPFEDDSFDAVLNTVSVDYMTNPVKVFSEVGRILKPGGLFLVSFSNRFFQEKVVKIWRQASSEQRIQLVESFFYEAAVFEDPVVFVSRGKPRPDNDKYTALGVPSDPVFMVYAEKRGGNGTKRPLVASSYHDRPYDQDEVFSRKQTIKDTNECPYCSAKLEKVEVPNTPFTEWPSDFIHVCLFDECPYFLFGWDAMTDQGSVGSYRFMYEPVLDNCYSVPVMNREELRGYVVED